MIGRATLPPISSILSRLNVPPGRRGRTKCPIHNGDNRQAFSYNDEKGVWFCHRCGIGGDLVELVKRTQGADFRGALSWLGLRPGSIPKPDSATIRRGRIRAGLRDWAKERARELRFEHYVRERVISAAKRRLKRDAQDEMGWSWLSWALKGQETISHHLDELEGNEEQKLEMFKTWTKQA